MQHISQVVDGGATLFEASSASPVSPDGIIVCTGLGSRFLGGVEDKDVYPIRGQTVIIHAPWVNKMISNFHPVEQQSADYIIPRKSGDVILGGVFTNNDW